MTAAAPMPACFNAWTRVVPVLRAETARRLTEEGLQQGRIAEHLGVSQAMVSKYLRQPPSPAGLPLSPHVVAGLVQASVRLALSEEKKGRIPAWCTVCQVGADEGFSIATAALSAADECLRNDGERAPQGAKTVLTNLAEAEALVRRLPFRPLVPEVRSNLAMALPEAKQARDVAAFPGRFIELKGEVRGAAPPEFGSSSHLAYVLLKVRRTQPRAHAVLNARCDDSVRRALRASGLKPVTLKRSRGDLSIQLPRTQSVDALIDPGAFGIEPALYLLGENAIDVVRKAERILKHLPQGT